MIDDMLTNKPVCEIKKFVNQKRKQHCLTKRQGRKPGSEEAKKRRREEAKKRRSEEAKKRRSEEAKKGRRL
jgi:hypothetical protein